MYGLLVRVMCRSLSMIAVLCLLPACSLSRVHFEPRERIDSESPRGFPASTYELVATGAQRTSELRVWSPGVQRQEDGKVLVRVGFEIENRFDEPLTLSVDRTEVVELDLGDSKEMLRPSLVSGEVTVDASRLGSVELGFELPAEVDPSDVESFSVRWAVDAPFEFVQHTPFRRSPRRRTEAYYWRARYPYYGWRRGGLYGYYGRFCW